MTIRSTLYSRFNLSISLYSTMALIEFLQSSDAKIAFKSLAYKKYKHVPLYLEWAPDDIFNTKANGKKDKVTTDIFNKKKDGVNGSNAHNEDGVDEYAVGASDLVESRNCLFIKNLNFNTTQDTLTKIIGQVISYLNIHDNIQYVY